MKIAALKILILGGSHFLGIHLTQELINHGHEVTLFNRGTHSIDLPVQQLRGDRDGNLEALLSYTWDAVIDTSGHLPRIVEQSAEMLASRANHYTFLSTIGVYRDFETVGIEEHYPLAHLSDPTAEEITEKTYGALKALCEAKVQNYFPERSLIVRSGLLVGPYDPTDRFTYWVRRMAKGGSMLAPAGQATQFIDARDLAQWIVSMIERDATGIYNATGPSYSLEHVLPDSTIWVDEDFLIEQDVQDWVELPLWLSTRRRMPGFLKISSQKALQAGLRIRPLGETISAILAWDTERGKPELKAGLDAQKEATLLARWEEHPFNYALHLFCIPGTKQRTLVCFHGYGENYQIAQTLKNVYHLDVNLVSFNFPEYDIKQGREYNPKTASFGTMDELLPALYVLKKLVIDQGLESIDLYGFSAGGGALINVIGVLNTSAHDNKLMKLGIREAEKKRLLCAIQKGIVLLDTPLKSIEEIIDFRGSTAEFEILAQNYRDHHFRPIDSIQKLKGLALDILLYFDKHDEIVSNRDDLLYIERLKTSHSGKTQVVVGDEGGHMGPHFSLWQAYSQN